MHGTRPERPESQRFCCKNVLFKRYRSFNVLVLCHLELLMNAEKSLKLTTPMSPAKTSEVGRHEKLTSNGHSLWLWPFFIIYLFYSDKTPFHFCGHIFSSSVFSKGSEFSASSSQKLF